MVGPNRAVFAHLHGMSAHSDTVQVLWAAIKDLPGVEFYCSDPKNFGYVVACSNDLVFAYAEGMQGVGLRLPEKRREQSLRRVLNRESLLPRNGYSSSYSEPAVSRSACSRLLGRPTI